MLIIKVFLPNSLESSTVLKEWVRFFLANDPSFRRRTASLMRSIRPHGGGRIKEVILRNKRGSGSFNCFKGTEWQM